MNDGRKRRQAKQARRDARRRAARPVPQPSLVQIVRDALDADHPLATLGLVGVIVETLMPHEFSYLLKEERIDPNPGLDAIASQLNAEYTAVLAVLAEMAVGDENFQQRCRDAIVARPDAVPRWIADLPKLTAGRAVRVSDPFGDLDQVLFGMQLTDGRELTCGVMIDHLVLSTVKDVGVWDKSLSAVLALIDSEGLSGNLTDITTADARAWIEQATGKGIVRRVRDNRPGFLAVVKWLAARLPEGGQPYQRVDADWRAAAEVMETFFASPAGKRFDRAEFEGVLEELMNQGTGDPLRWSPFRITHTLTDVPDDRDYSVETMLRVPALMRAFVPVAHAHSGIRDALTAETLSAIDDVQTQIEERVRGRLQEYWDFAG